VNRLLIFALALAISCGVSGAQSKTPPRKSKRSFQATAYSKKGKTQTGTHTGKGVVAADPRVLPKGSTVEVKGAGPYSGRYKVADTGSAVKGRKIDIYEPDPEKAKQFGRKKVEVKVVKPPAEEDE
jgi:3D (Asp-Asp-Asp) domain-containing protein